jgi:hypothetical protein
MYDLATYSQSSILTLNQFQILNLKFFYNEILLPLFVPSNIKANGYCGLTIDQIHHTIFQFISK